MEEQILQLLDFDQTPPEKLIQQVEQFYGYVFSDLRDEVIHDIAAKLHFYAQLMKELPEWRKASKLSSAELADASEVLGKAVECIYDNLLRTDDAVMYHIEAIESFAWEYRKAKGRYPTDSIDEHYKHFEQGVAGLFDIAERLKILRVVCDFWADHPREHLPNFGKTGPVRYEDSKKQLIYSLYSLIEPYTVCPVDDLRDLLAFIGEKISIKRLKNILCDLGLSTISS